MMQNKFSILIPSYNDEKYIEETLLSVINQTYDNWEIILIDDGSTDRTKEKVQNYINEKIHYIYQENADQLNALKNGAQYISGDIVLLLHSDDLLASNEVLERFNKIFNTYNEIDGLYADYILINENSEQTGVLKTLDYIKIDVFKYIFWSRGSNMIGDTFVVKKNVFLNQISNNYIKNNTIYYLNPTMLNLIRTDSWYKYRVFNENYIHSDVGKYVLFSGTQRTIYTTYSKYSFSFSKVLFSPYIYKVFSKFKLYRFLSLKKHDFENWDFLLVYYNFWMKILKKGSYPKVALSQIRKIIDSILSRKKNLEESVGITLNYEGEKVYNGCDARKFYEEYSNNNVKGIYKEILEKKYDYIIVKNSLTEQVVKEALLFYGLYYEVKRESTI